MDRRKISITVGRKEEEKKNGMDSWKEKTRRTDRGSEDG
jgi:hypothetical protein